MENFMRNKIPIDLFPKKVILRTRFRELNLNLNKILFPNDVQLGEYFDQMNIKFKLLFNQTSVPLIDLTKN